MTTLTSSSVDLLPLIGQSFHSMANPVRLARRSCECVFFFSFLVGVLVYICVRACTWVRALRGLSGLLYRDTVIDKNILFPRERVRELNLFPNDVTRPTLKKRTNLCLKL